MKSRITLLATLGVCLSACFDEPSGPPGVIVPPSCGNGVCEIAVEGCINCPSDCDCCAVVDASGTVPVPAELPFAQGQPDQRVVQIDERSDLWLGLGSEAKDGQVLGAKELTVHGSVITSDALFADCPLSSDGRGAVEVWGISGANGNTRLIGIWTARTNTFDVGCGELESVVMVRLKAQPGTSATLDALTINADACRGGAL